mmetsp:Transcript_26908/g.30004  ORF Transcript_26908/g.30004 Transcript_26908/m.30004 type:complete len:231 (+) Transcript_26908:141-833(+)
MSIPPSQTLYVNNLNEKVKKEELKKSLYALFSQYGPILDIVATKTAKMRGQAFIVFGEVGAAGTALNAMQSFDFYEKPMRIAYSKTKSDAIARLDGTYVPREKRKKEQENKRKAEEAMGITAEDSAPPAKKPKVEKEGGEGAAPKIPEVQRAPPHKVLFVQNLPEESNEMMVSMLFRQFPGFLDVRMAPGKTGIAFVEFEDENQSGLAMRNLQNFEVTNNRHMVISFAKK